MFTITVAAGKDTHTEYETCRSRKAMVNILVSYIYFLAYSSF